MGWINETQSWEANHTLHPEAEKGVGRTTVGKDPLSRCQFSHAGRMSFFRCRDIEVGNNNLSRYGMQASKTIRRKLSNVNCVRQIFLTHPS